MVAITWQASDWIAMVGIVVSPLGAIAVAFLNGRQREIERAEVERERTRAESASVLGPILVLLNDADPYGLALRSGPQTADEFKELHHRWGELRPLLGVMGASDPTWSQEALRLLTAIDNALYSARLWAMEPINAKFKNAAEQDHTQALQQATSLVNLIWARSGHGDVVMGFGRGTPPPAPEADAKSEGEGAT